MENAVRTTHNLAAVLFDTSARLNNKADTIASNVEYRGEEPASAAGTAAPPSAANDVLNRTIDNLLRLENTLDRIHESVGRAGEIGSVAVVSKQAAMGASTTARRSR